MNLGIQQLMHFKTDNEDEQSDNGDNQLDNEDIQSDNEDNQSDNDDQSNHNYKKINKKEDEKKTDKYVLHFQGNHADYIKEFIISTGFEESLIYIRG